MSRTSKLVSRRTDESVLLLTKTLWRRKLRFLLLYLFMLPTILFLLVFNYFPAGSAFYHSMFNWHPGFPSDFVGLSNFVQAFHDRDFLRGFLHVSILVVFGVTLAFAIPFLSAELLNAVRNRRMQSFLKGLLVLPLAFPGIVTLLLWGFMFNPDQGLINTLLHRFGMHGVINWLGSPHLALVSLMLIGFPWVAGLPFLIYLAALQAIPSELHEAAVMDGCSVWNRICRIDIPLVMPQTRLLIVLAVTGWMQNIVPMMLLTNGGPSYATIVPGLWTFDQAFSFGQWGYAAALSVLLFIVMIVISVVSWRLTRRASEVVS